MGERKRHWWQPSVDYEPKTESAELRRARLAREPVVEELRRWRRRVAALGFTALMFAGLLVAAPAWLRTDPNESSMTEFLHELGEVHQAMAPDELLVGFAGLVLSSVLVLLLPSTPWGASPDEVDSRPSSGRVDR